MAAEEGRGDSCDAMPGWKGKIESEWGRIKEHAETYPYVWGSYILVYGGLGTFLVYRWRKLRRTEDRVRALQERLRKLVEAEGSQAGGAAGSASSSTAATRSDAAGQADQAFVSRPNGG